MYNNIVEFSFRHSQEVLNLEKEDWRFTILILSDLNVVKCGMTWRFRYRF